MTYPVPTSATGFHLVLYFNCGTVAGWDEEYFWGGSGSWDAVEQDVVRLVAARRLVLNRSSRVLGVRISAWPDEDAGSKLRVAGGYSGPGQAADSPASPLPPWVAVQISLHDASLVYRREFMVRGLARPSIVWESGPFTGLSALGQGQAAPLLSLLRNDPLPGWPMRGLWCIAGQSRDPAVSRETGITALARATPCGTLVTTEGAPGWAVGELVEVGGLRGCNPKGLNGPARVLAVAGHVTTITQEACCCGPLGYSYGGRLKKVVLGLYAHARAEPGNIRKRDTGSVFLRFTWAPQWPVVLPFHPCGQVLDLLRHGYPAHMRLAEGLLPVAVVWGPAAEDAVVFEDLSPFRSRKYIHPYREYTGIGEQLPVCWDSCRHQDVAVRCPEFAPIPCREE